MAHRKTEYEVEIELASGVELKFKGHWDGEKSLAMSVDGSPDFPLSDTDLHLLVTTIMNLDRVIHQKDGG